MEVVLLDEGAGEMMGFLTTTLDGPACVWRSNEID